MSFPSTSGGTYMGSYRPERYSWDQVRSGAAGPLYVPPPNPEPTAAAAPPAAAPKPEKINQTPFNWSALPPYMRPLSQRNLGRPPGGANPSPRGSNPPRGGGLPLAGNGPPSPSPAAFAPPPFSPGRLPAPFEPGAGPAAFSGPKATDSNTAAAALRNLGKRVRINAGAKASLDGPAADNVWESLALDKFGQGFDRGPMFEGKELPDTVFSEAQVNQMAQQRAAPTIRALKDADEMFASQAGRSGTYNPAARAAMQARAAIEGAGAINSATRDAQLDAAKANAEQAIAARENARSNFSTDVAARLGFGNLDAGVAENLLSGGLQRRGLDQTRDITRYQGDITQRGQNLDAATSSAAMNNARDLARASGERELFSLKDNAALERGRMGLTARGQDVDRAGEIDRTLLAARGQDITAGSEADRMQLGARGQDIDFANAQSDRQNRMAMLDRQLADSSLDRESRAALERERMALDREMRMAELEQRSSQFSEQLGVNVDQFGRTLGENQRQFDAAQALTREQGSRNRDLTRYLNPPTPQVNQGDIQRMIEEALRRQMGGGAGERPLTQADMERLLKLAEFN